MLHNDAVLPGEQLAMVGQLQVFEFGNQYALVRPLLQCRHLVQDLARHFSHKRGRLMLQQVCPDRLDILERVPGPDDLDAALQRALSSASSSATTAS